MLRRKNVKTVLLTSTIWLLLFSIITYLYSIFQDQIYLGDKVFVYTTTRDIQIGEKISDKDITRKKINISDAVNGVELDVSKIIGKRAIVNINKNQQITKNLIIDDILMFNSESRFYTIPVSVSSTGGNIVNPWDYVDIIISYKDAQKPAEVVLSKRIVYDIRTPEGKSVYETGKITPAYATFVLSLEEIKIIDDALKQGTLYLSKYFDKNAKPTEETYTPTWE